MPGTSIKYVPSTLTDGMKGGAMPAALPGARRYTSAEAVQRTAHVPAASERPARTA